MRHFALVELLNRLHKVKALGPVAAERRRQEVSRLSTLKQGINPRSASR